MLNHKQSLYRITVFFTLSAFLCQSTISASPQHTHQYLMKDSWTDDSGAYKSFDLAQKLLVQIKEIAEEANYSPSLTRHRIEHELELPENMKSLVGSIEKEGSGILVALGNGVFTLTPNKTGDVIPRANTLEGNGLAKKRIDNHRKKQGKRKGEKSRQSETGSATSKPETKTVADDKSKKAPLGIDLQADEKSKKHLITQKLRKWTVPVLGILTLAGGMLKTHQFNKIQGEYPAWVASRIPRTQVFLWAHGASQEYTGYLDVLNNTKGLELGSDSYENVWYRIQVYAILTDEIPRMIYEENVLKYIRKFLKSKNGNFNNVVLAWERDQADVSVALESNVDDTQKQVLKTLTLRMKKRGMTHYPDLARDFEQHGSPEAKKMLQEIKSKRTPEELRKLDRLEVEEMAAKLMVMIEGPLKFLMATGEIVPQKTEEDRNDPAKIEIRGIDDQGSRKKTERLLERALKISKALEAEESLGDVPPGRAFELENYMDSLLNKLNNVSDEEELKLLITEFEKKLPSVTERFQEGIENLKLKSLIKDYLMIYPDFERFSFRRTQEMAKNIAPSIQSGKEVFILVGANHEGAIKILKREYKDRPISGKLILPPHFNLPSPNGLVRSLSDTVVGNTTQNVKNYVLSERNEKSLGDLAEEINLLPETAHGVVTESRFDEKTRRRWLELLQAAASRGITLTDKFQLFVSTAPSSSLSEKRTIELEGGKYLVPVVPRSQEEVGFEEVQADLVRYLEYEVNLESLLVNSEEDILIPGTEHHPSVISAITEIELNVERSLSKLTPLKQALYIIAGAT